MQHSLVPRPSASRARTAYVNLFKVTYAVRARRHHATRYMHMQDLFHWMLRLHAFSPHRLSLAVATSTGEGLVNLPCT